MTVPLEMVQKMAEMLGNPRDDEPRPVNERKLVTRVVIVIVLLGVAVTGMIYTLHAALTLPPMPTTTQPATATTK